MENSNVNSKLEKYRLLKIISKNSWKMLYNLSIIVNVNKNKRGKYCGVRENEYIDYVQYEKSRKRFKCLHREEFINKKLKLQWLKNYYLTF